jgi:hypothetical protein
LRAFTVKPCNRSGTDDGATVAGAKVAAKNSSSKRRMGQKMIVQSQSGAFVPGDGSYLFEVVGESHYQADLERIVGGRTEDSASFQCVGTLIPEPDNPYDPQAVCVSVDGCTVAHLSRDWAAKFKDALLSSGYARASCKALIVGGWDRGEDDRGHFGIKLDIALPLNFQPVTR